MRQLKIILSFYKSFIAASSIITIACLSSLYINGLKTLSIIILFKLISLGLTILYINSYKSNEFYYYNNLGFPKLILWLIALTIDLAFFATFIPVTLIIK